MKKVISRWLLITFMLVVIFAVGGCSKHADALNSSVNSTASTQYVKNQDSEDSDYNGLFVDISENEITYQKVAVKNTSGVLTSSARKNPGASDEGKFIINDKTTFIVRSTHDQGTKVDPDRQGSKEDLKPHCNLNIWGSKEKGSFLAKTVLITLFDK